MRTNGFTAWSPTRGRRISEAIGYAIWAMDQLKKSTQEKYDFVINFRKYWQLRMVARCPSMNFENLSSSSSDSMRPTMRSW